MKHLLTIVLILAALGELVARAEGGRTKVIDFENSVVEGINRQPYDSLNQVSDAQKRKNRPHLYRKRAGFSSEIRETLAEMRFAQ